MNMHTLVAATWRLARTASLLPLAAVAVGSIAWAAAPSAEKPKVAPNVKSVLPPQVIPQGLGFNIHISGPDSDWDAIKASGAKFVRADFPWDHIEKAKGVYDFSVQDKMLDALTERGIRIDFGLQYRNPLYPNPETTDEGREAYSKWAAASVKHFKGRNVIWELWNEPNVQFWKGTGGDNSPQFADQYVALVKKAVPAMRAADPDCYILGGSVSNLWVNSFKWVDESFKQGLLTTGINALSVHPYGFSRPELAIDKIEPGAKDFEGYGYLRSLMAKHNAPKDFPTADSEVGYEAAKGRTLEQQAMLFVRTYLVDQMCGMRLTIWYNWDENDAATMRVRSKPGAEPLPVYKACQNMTAELTGFHFVERLKSAGGTDYEKVDYVLVFENAAKGRKIVAWTVPQARDDSQDKAKAHDIKVPATSPVGAVAVRDLYGKAVEAKAEAGMVTVNLTASPLYIDFTGKPPAAPVATTTAAK